MAGIRRFELTLVIASAAKQSISPRKERKNGLLRFARNDGPDYKRDFAPRGTKRPSRAFISRPPRGRGECRVPDAPAASCALCIGRTHTSNNEYTRTPGIPARNGFTAYVVLSPVTGLFCHRRPQSKVLSKPGWADLNSANLTPASGRQDHTILPSASNISRQRAVDRSQVPENPPCDPIARKTLPRPPHPTPRS